LQGICHDYLGQHAEAIACYRACIALRPTYFASYYNRGLAYLKLGSFHNAIADFDQTLSIKDDFTEAYIQRAIAYQGLGKNTDAIDDLTIALERGFAPTRAYFLRAKLRDKMRDWEGAKLDRAEGLRREPADDHSCIARGIAFLPENPKRALADFDDALKFNPRSLAGLQNKAHVLGKYLKRTEEAITVLDKAIELYPDDVRPLAGRGVYLARLGKRDAAIKDAEAALALDYSASNLYQVAGIYALTSREVPDDQKEALRLLALTLKKGFGFDYLEIDRDLDPIRQAPTFRRVIEASRAMQSAAPAKR
jgi:tetratricopeptide (TPR) repeat protein